MKKKMTIEISCCDFCGEEHSYYKCMECNKDFCSDCVEQGRAVKYEYSVYFSSSAYDGRYCKECDSKLRKSKTSNLHQYYLQMKSLQLEYNGFHKDFKERQDKLEAKLLEEYKLGKYKD